ncbi:MAG: RNA-binding protein [Endomicrobiales bacterium]|nr:RNA-binding protein [Endomicrobiales bacterium]
MKIYIGNLSQEVLEDELKGLFEPFGIVSNINIIKDKSTGQPKGFAFLEVEGKAKGFNAINELNGKEVKEKKIIVKRARNKPQDRFFAKSRRY